MTDATSPTRKAIVHPMSLTSFLPCNPSIIRNNADVLTQRPKHAEDELPTLRTVIRQAWADPTHSMATLRTGDDSQLDKLIDLAEHFVITSFLISGEDRQLRYTLHEAIHLLGFCGQGKCHPRQPFSTHGPFAHYRLTRYQTTIREPTSRLVVSDRFPFYR